MSLGSLAGFALVFVVISWSLSAFASLVLRGARARLQRLGPMAELCAGLALIPLVLAGSEPGNELQAPLGIVILGGLLSATALNMLVVPALYAWLARPRETAPSPGRASRRTNRNCFGHMRAGRAVRAHTELGAHRLREVLEGRLQPNIIECLDPSRRAQLRRTRW